MSPSVRTPVRRCSPADLDAFPALFVDYCSNFDEVADFYRGDWRDPSVRAAVAEEAAHRPVDRAAVANVLDEQNADWGSPDAVHENIEALRQSDAVAIVTGQQVGLFTGPLYTIYKTITALNLADEWSEQLDRPVIPIFWVEGEDHDFEEIATTHLLRRNEVVSLSYEPGVRENPGPVGRLPLTEDIVGVLERLDDTLPSSDFKPAVMERVRAAYAADRPIEDAFAHLLRSLFEDEGLVFMNPDDRRLKKLTSSLFRREIEDPDTPADRIASTSQALQDRGYHAQVHARPTNLFWLTSDGRYAIDREENGRFVLRGQDRSFTTDELLDELEEAPERFSPNVVLRPLMQDTLLPTAAYVGGPAEVSYFAQYRDVYEWAGLDMPLIHPRATVTLVEGKVQKVLDRYDLEVCDFRDDLDVLFQDIVVDTMDVDVEEIFQEATTEIHKTINRLKPEVEAVDQTLSSATEAARAGIVDHMQELKQKVVRAEKRQQDEVRSQLEKAHANVRPEGGLQERTINVLYFLNKYSLDLIEELRHVLQTDTSEHQVVEL